ncbi:uncharacterized protein LOC111718110 isoform X2 [Eurytemora carolleeae]|uniref:uncharacterized protein LOC111718110 isoform X2 n=1 Tax=Eurytemora carolleeae TaxID=1294199 RepID=UPI000C772423|nr:uncharacterized protein LOC111718110 isoform X2 [Eurytemora carolleeae]|eukprot:XP_023349382.1 uncharacterized protein LOC111718110 isoform X2 [Eurytemora affinis]
MESRQKVSKVMRIPGDKTGLIIGQRGATIRDLKSILGITNVHFDTRNGPGPDGYNMLTIVGINEDSVNKVEDRVNSLLYTEKKTPKKFFGNSRVLFLWEGVAHENADMKLVLQDEEEPGCLVKEVYQIKSISPREAPELSLDGLNLRPQPTFMQGFNDELVKNVFTSSLEAKMASTTEFTYSLGEEMFKIVGASQAAESFQIPIRNGRVLHKDLKDLKLEGYWSTSLSATRTARMVKCLKDDGFTCINEEAEGFTIVHLDFKPEKLTASIVLGEEAYRGPLGSSKKTNIQESSSGSSSEPLVQSVQTNKLKSGDQLSKKLKDILNQCWMNRDAEGGIAEPEAQTGLRFNLVKQVLHKMYFNKSVMFKDKPEVLQVCINKLRRKQAGQEWCDSLEIDVHFGEFTSDVKGSELADRFQFVRNWLNDFEY